MPGIELISGENHYPTVKVSWLLEQLEKENAIGETDDSIRQVLIVIDDLVSDIKKLSGDDNFIRLFYNRRHYLPHIHIHYIITTQKWNMIPMCLRATMTMLISFAVSTKEWVTIESEVRIENIKLLTKALPLIWNVKGNFLAVDVVNNKIYKNFDKLLL